MPTTAHGAQVLNGIVNQRAAILACNDDWKLMMLTSLPMLLLLMRGSKKGDGVSAEHAAVMD
jgi:MFS transporter, DHA2 family, multidrug resistance protein